MFMGCLPRTKAGLPRVFGVFSCLSLPSPRFITELCSVEIFRVLCNPCVQHLLYRTLRSSDFVAFNRRIFVGTERAFLTQYERSKSRTLVDTVRTGGDGARSHKTARTCDRN